MKTYQVSIAYDGARSNILLSVDLAEMGSYIKDSSHGYHSLKELLVSQKWIPTAARIMTVKPVRLKHPECFQKIPLNAKPGSESEESANVAKRARTVTSVSQSVCQVLAKKAVSCALVALPIITAALLYAGDHYMNGGALRGRVLEQLGLNEEAIQGLQTEFSLFCNECRNYLREDS